MILVIFKSAWQAPAAELVGKTCDNEFWACFNYGTFNIKHP